MSRLVKGACGCVRPPPAPLGRAGVPTVVVHRYPRSVWVHLLALGVLSFIQNGVVPSIATYVLLPFKSGDKVRSDWATAAAPEHRRVHRLPATAATTFPACCWRPYAELAPPA
jgi:hypothetical protein